MKITGKVHCLFEQSGTFRDEFRRLNYPALDYDIANEFGKTDVVCNIFRLLEVWRSGGYTLLNKFTPDDFLMIFFPCTYFSSQSQAQFLWNNNCYRGMSPGLKVEKILERSAMREIYYRRMVTLYGFLIERGLRAVIENPWGKSTSFLCNNFVVSPDVIDTNRRRRGDWFRKPTAYWFVNCTPGKGRTYLCPSQYKTVEGEDYGIARSLISPDYARAFIKDYILHEPEDDPQQQLNFD